MMSDLPPNTFDECLVNSDNSWPYSEVRVWMNNTVSQNHMGQLEILFGNQIKHARSSKQSKIACGVCDLRPTLATPQGQFLKLKGICKMDMWAVYDLNYYVHGTYDGRPVFKGTTIRSGH